MEAQRNPAYFFFLTRITVTIPAARTAAAPMQIQSTVCVPDRSEPAAAGGVTATVGVAVLSVVGVGGAFAVGEAVGTGVGVAGGCVGSSVGVGSGVGVARISGISNSSGPAIMPW